MQNNLIQKLFASGKIANQKLSQLNTAQRAKVEEAWDVEHAYYSSALEGSKLDKKEFEALAKKTK